MDLNVAIAYGSLPGHSTTVSDAIKAYVQSFLNSGVPTYIEFPKHLCPPEWSHLRRPVCRLVRALYGHPEAGGHWERHLAKIVVQLGGVVVPNHPSCFWFGDLRLFLIIYVDDLLLAGPTSSHAPFWEKLGKQVNLDPFENLDRYLGRHHSFEPCSRLDVNLLEHFTSPIEA